MPAARDSYLTAIDPAHAPAVLALDGVLRAGTGILRTLDFKSLEDIDAGLVTGYVREAVSRLEQFKAQEDKR